MTYREFLEAKIDVAPASGLAAEESEVNPALKPHQRCRIYFDCTCMAEVPDGGGGNA